MKNSSLQPRRNIISSVFDRNYTLHFSILFLILLIAVMPLSSAFGEVKHFDKDKPVKGQIDIIDNFGLPFISTKKADYIITSWTDQCLIDCSGEFLVNVYSSEKIFDSLKFKGKDGLIKTRQYLFYINDTESYQSPIYSNNCSNITFPANGTNSSYTQEVCNQYQSGTETKYKEIMKPYNFEVVQSGTYKVRLEAKKSAFESIDALPTAQGIELSEWAWWNASWSAYKMLSIKEGSGANLINYTTLITVTYDADMNADFSDLRFIAGDNTTEIGYWIQNYTASTSASIWLNTSLLANVNNTFYMYYKNAGASTTSSRANVWKTSLVDSHGATFSAGATLNNPRGFRVTTKFPVIILEATNYSGGTNQTNFILSNATAENILMNVSFNTTTVILEPYTLATTTLYYMGVAAYPTRSGYKYGSFSLTAGTNINWTGGAYSEGTWTADVNGGGLSSIKTDRRATTEPLVYFGAEQVPAGITSSLNSPVNNYNSTSQTITFNCSATASGGINIANITLYIYNTSLYTNTTNLTGTYNQTTWTKTLADGNYTWNCLATGDDGLTDWDVNRTLRVDTLYPQIVVVSPTNTTYTYGTNVTINYTVTDLNRDSCWFNYNGINTSMNCSLNNSFIANETIGYNNLTIWANDTFGNYNSSKITFIIDFILAPCNATYNVTYVNYTFKESTGSFNPINASMDSASITYWVTTNPEVAAKTLTFSNSSLNWNYTLCGYPNKSISANVTLLYSSTSGGVIYPQRSYRINDHAYTNTMETKVLYLLSSNNGQYVTFQIINSALNPLSGVVASATETINGVATLVEERTSDDSGAVVMFLNPLYNNYMSFVKTGYVTYNSNLVPTQTSYTITLSGTSTSNITDTTSELRYIIQPINSYLLPNSNYNFNLTINNSDNNFDDFSLMIKNQTGSVINTSTSTTATGGVINFVLNTTNNKYLTVYANWTIDGVTSYNWKTYVISNYSGTDFSLAYLFTDLKAYTDSGMFGLDDFGTALIIFVIIFLITGVMSYNFGIYSPAAIAGIITAQVAFWDVGLGMITPASATAGIYAPTILFGVIFIALFIKEASSY